MIVSVGKDALGEAIDALVVRANWYSVRCYETPVRIVNSLHELCAIAGLRVIVKGNRRYVASESGTR